MHEFVAMPEIDLGNCATCPNALHLAQEVEYAGRIANRSVEVAMAADLTEVAEQVKSALLSGMLAMDIETGKIISDTDEVDDLIKKGVMNHIEQQDQHVDELRNNARELLSACELGPLKMRAQRAGRTVVVTVCQSSILPDGESCEDVHIRRTTE